MSIKFARRSVIKLLGTALFTLSAGAMLGSYTPAASAAPVADEETLTFLNYRDLRDLNPHLYGGEMFAQEMLFEGLVTLGNDGSYHPAVAESWTISPDGRVYTFKIRKGMTFTDGEVLDAYAVEKNFDALIDNKKRHSWLEMMRLLVSAKATDAETFVITMKEPYYPMLTELAVTRPFAFVSPKVMKDGKTKDGVTSFIGSGQWILKEHVIDEYSVFERNENYWGKKPAYKRVIVKVIPDNQTRILALEKGEADLIWGKNMVDADALNKYRDSDKFGIAVSDPTSTRQIVLNTNNEFLRDANVRRALQHATNKAVISQGVFHGLEPAADTLYAKSIPYCNIDLKPYEANMKKAAELLEQAGWKRDGRRAPLMKDGKAMELNLLYNSNSVSEKTIAEYLQSEFGKLGIKVTIRGEEEQSYRDNMKNGHFDLVFNICWGTPYDPQSSLAAMRQRVYGDYAAQLGLPDKAEIDKAITEILTSTDETRRQELYTFVLKHLHDDAVYIPITYETNKALFNKKVGGVGFLSNQYEVPFGDMYPVK
ncbi:nickel ABC transporter substrate-binding protein [Sutterella sp.]|uniref:nickel ABC transporter substrate-binding protein n=1 Tax=Sutterella sp. TaxID=1981025 RepID=UPI0026E10000|nr:nickel ABC transporter substrate-binding protein [Sutterella sp.]MDO5532495.1 nickel ABC transporter substrate-binding protein [Sutterella sp.]